MTHYLVKWCSLSYEEATWELQEDLDPEKIKEFEEIQKLPPDLRHVVSKMNQERIETFLQFSGWIWTKWNQTHNFLQDRHGSYHCNTLSASFFNLFL